jgi:hypothetical protein
MSKPKRTLKQIAIDMRAAGEMLIEGAAEIEAAGTLLESVNLSALTTLLGGGAVESAPFQPASPNENTPGERSTRRKKAAAQQHPPKLTKEQKAEIREKWNRLPEGLRTEAQKMAWAERYGVPTRVISLIVGTDMEVAKQRMLAARARIGHSRSEQTPQTHTSVN